MNGFHRRQTEREAPAETPQIGTRITFKKTRAAIHGKSIDRAMMTKTWSEGRQIDRFQSVVHAPAALHAAIRAGQADITDAGSVEAFDIVEADELRCEVLLAPAGAD